MTEQNVKEAAHDQGGKGGDAAPQVRKKEGGLAGKFKEAAKWIVLGVAGFFLNEGLTWAKDKQLGGDDQLQKIAEQQKTEFAALKESLGKLGQDLAAGDRDNFKKVSSSIASIQAQNRDLIRMIALAREENERTRQLARANSGINGGYDFILTEGRGLQLDAYNAIGLYHVTGSSVTVNMSRAGEENDVRQSLNPGQSVRYRAESGEDCRISLLSLAGDRETASFSRLCTQAG
ncbi:hypothetical protein CSC62_00835 [Pseudoxanthomonas jiangsuensis]|uniref:hypothetical protein n=1 Tax=Pseudoxanthomonas jiangsuensis TaxID=619688 RepID=UPI0013908F74|nr:hypothetical protein [Pseudoxanthomonas jiangsuensis]KAF1699479.1 hypothetical protein CSC62_00835 [Pseudoxanthomonas jiangsuensis]